MTKAHTLWTWTPMLAAAFGVVACGPEGLDESSGSVGSRPAITTSDDIVGTATQAFGESTCGSASLDGQTSGGDGSVVSTNASYDHSGCSHTFVVQANSAPATSRAFAAYQPAPTAPCNAMWAAMSLWKLVNGTFTKVGDGGLTYGAQAPDGSCLKPSSELQIPNDGTYKVIGQAGWATSYQQVKVGVWSATTYDMSAHDDRGWIGDGDWATGLFKGECLANRYIQGVSRISPGSQGVRNILCSQQVFVNTSTVTLDFTSRDDMRAGDIDWDFGFTKGECPAGSAMTALAQTSSGVVNKARCAPSANRNFDCKTYDFSSGDTRATLDGGDWSFGDSKGECESNRAVVGISKDNAGKPKAIRCCRLLQ